MRIAILGSGLMGGKLGTLFARLGHHVTFSYARTQRKLQRLAKQAGPTARAGSPKDAAQNPDVLLLAVHWSRIDDVLKQAGNLSGKIIISCCLPMSTDDSKLIIAHTNSGAEQLARKLRRSHFVSAFGTIPSEVLFDVFARRRRSRKNRPSLIYCGDDRKAKKIVARLIAEIGFEPIDAGPLRIARYTEPFSLLVAQLAYEGKNGSEMAYRFEWFEKAPM